MPKDFGTKYPIWLLGNDGSSMDEYHNEEYDLIEHDDYWLIPLRGTRVAKIIIDLALRIEFIDASENETLIWIGGSIRIRSQGNEYMLHGDNPKELAPILELWGSAVDSAAAHKDGRLEVKFRDGSDFCAYPLPATESWGVTGQRWLRIVCMPGGDLAVWKSDPVPNNQ